MRTLVISDLHLGSRRPVDILRRPEPLDALCSGLAEIDRLVLLGDVLELRQGPLRDAMAVARPVLEALGAALPKGAEVILTAGNHDHPLVAPWLARRGQAAEPEPLGLEARAGADASWATQAIGDWLGRGRSLSVAYPGVWLREDVWATHGHYLDRLITIPTFERIAAGGMARVVGRLPDGPGARADAEDFEAALAPMYAWLDQLANGRAAGSRWVTGGATAKAWSLLSADGRAPLRGRALAALLPLGIAGINLAGLGPVRHKIDSEELRRAGIAALGGTLALLGVDAPYVVFGHTHCAGPLPWMNAAEWRVNGTTQLVNAGCWTDEPAIDTTERSPYRPGYGVLLEADPAEPPRLVRITEHLGERPGHSF
ncbi:MAG: metallophosphoesterase [Solirubrobacteraceae bacterium]|nr:metallophosphoesterase [Solirubrobacteraceae bacterium]